MIRELVRAFDYSLAYIQQSVADLADDELVAQPAGAPNHAMWTLGHISGSCQGVAEELGVRPWLPADWEATFGYGSTPSADRSRYPAKAEMVAQLADAASRLRETLLATDESVLDKPWPDEALPTLGQVLLQVVVAHTAYHAGQITLWRRAIGKQAPAVFV